MNFAGRGHKYVWCFSLDQAACNLCGEGLCGNMRDFLSMRPAKIKHLACTSCLRRINQPLLNLVPRKNFYYTATENAISFAWDSFGFPFTLVLSDIYLHMVKILV